MEHLEKLIKSLSTEVSIKKCAEHLNDMKEAQSIITPVGHLLLDNNEEVQVQVTVTRVKAEMMPDLEYTVFNS